MLTLYANIIFRPEGSGQPDLLQKIIGKKIRGQGRKALGSDTCLMRFRVNFASSIRRSNSASKPQYENKKTYLLV